MLPIEGPELGVDDVGPDPASGTLDELLDLVAVPIEEHRSADPCAWVGAEGTGPHVAGDGLGIAAGQLGRRVGAAGEIERFEDLHDLPVRLLHGPSGSGAVLGVGTPQGSPSRGDRAGGTGSLWGDQLSTEREISCPSARKSVSAWREIGMSAVSASRCALEEQMSTDPGSPGPICTPGRRISATNEPNGSP
jgi:hypothetical protein